MMKNLASEEFLEATRAMIWDNVTHEVRYYGPAGASVDDAGTSHISVLAADGAAFSMTSTINLQYVFIRIVFLILALLNLQKDLY